MENKGYNKRIVGYELRKMIKEQDHDLEEYRNILKTRLQSEIEQISDPLKEDIGESLQERLRRIVFHE